MQPSGLAARKQASSNALGIELDFTEKSQVILVKTLEAVAPVRFYLPDHNMNPRKRQFQAQV
jgi:hypothetical protein